jgi:hypothetical protein
MGTANNRIQGMNRAHMRGCMRENERQKERKRALLVIFLTTSGNPSRQPGDSKPILGLGFRVSVVQGAGQVGSVHAMLIKLQFRPSRLHYSLLSSLQRFPLLSMAYPNKLPQKQLTFMKISWCYLDLF